MRACWPVLEVAMGQCWRWQGSHWDHGRPVLNRTRVYHIIWSRWTGQPWPTGLVAHHLCETPWCINPMHIQPLTATEHNRTHGKGGDWGQAAKERCPAGHDYDEKNTYITPRGDRNCRKCCAIAQRRYRERKALTCS